MGEKAFGWALVVIQVGLLALLVALPVDEAWPTPRWVDLIAGALVVAGIAIVLVAARGLGRSLTPSPVPRDQGDLVTEGLYRYVRHPIYSGALLVVVGLVLRSGSLAVVATAAVLVVFFNLKARFEERKLAARYPDYGVYAASTSRFVPRVSGR